MSQTCSTCGATNLDSAPWCNQCFASFAPEPPEPAQPAAVAVDIEEAMDAVMAGSGTVGGDDPGPAVGSSTGNWTCRSCESLNPIDLNVCAVCGVSIFEAFGAEKQERPDVAPRTALVWALVVPGMGHVKTGHGILGLTLGTLILFSGVASAALASSSQTVAAWFFGLAHLGLWALSAFDAVALANGNRPLLEGRRITIVAGVLVFVIIVQVISQIGGAG